MSGELPGTTALPRSVRWSVRSWFIAVAAGVIETAIHVLTSEDYDAAVQLPVRVVVYVLVVALLLQLVRGSNWARIVLTVVLGGLGLFSLLAEPISWGVAGGSPGAFLAAADAPTLAVIGIRTVHVLAVVVALALMYQTSANRYFRSESLRAQETAR